MKQKTWNKIIGFILFLFAIGLFCLQIGLLLFSKKYQVEYIDNRLFYIFNIFCVTFLTLAILLLIKLTRKNKFYGAFIVVSFIILHSILIFDSEQRINNVTSISPNFKHVLSVKENVESGDTFYFRSYYGILARPKERLPQSIDGNFKVKWLANDVVAVTYKAADQTLQQFIGTYGDRGSGHSYYYVGAEIHGRWESQNITVISNQEGISVSENGKTQLFLWDNIVQFGTIAIVLKNHNEAAWTISLDESFKVDSDSTKPKVGTITLYKATMKKNHPITLNYKSLEK
ncbi:hypothetical protein [Metabacillus litoralis]|uniref:hypothetical protein n=1 Tax=Metabacillus litoralis TaxID=152268 RepID=UPI001CFEB9D9|nr:hypothetical protein [Metabacillus litoralis]